MADPIPAAAIREAAAFLAEQGFKPGDIPTRGLVEASRELGKSLKETLALVAALHTGSQGQGQAPEASKLAA